MQALKAEGMLSPTAHNGDTSAFSCLREAEIDESRCMWKWKIQTLFMTFANYSLEESQNFDVFFG